MSQHLDPTPKQTDLNSLNENLDNIAKVDLSGLNSASSISALYNCTGTLTETVKYKIVGKKFVMGGRYRITSASRTGANPGIEITLPNGYKTTATVDIGVGFAGNSDGIRYMETTLVQCNAESTTIRIRQTETVSNFTSNAIWGVIPMIVIPITTY